MNTTSTSATARSVRKALEQSNIHIDDIAGGERGMDLVEKARAIVKGERHLAPGHVKTTADGKLEDEEEAIRWIETAWEEDGLKCTWNTDFTRDSIPRLDIRDPTLYILTAFSADEKHINIKHRADKPIDEAENQCARSGAAMVRLKRKFDSLADGTYVDEEAKRKQDKDKHRPADKTSHKQEIPTDHFQADTKSFAFTLAIRPRDAKVFVHLGEETFTKKGQSLTTNWHAHELADYNLKHAGRWIELHRDIDNVLDLGTLTWKQEMKDLCNKILESEQSRKIRRNNMSAVAADPAPSTLSPLSRDVSSHQLSPSPTNTLHPGTTTKHATSMNI
uniref:Uncharacterized protein n=1 Tax=Cladonia uncialis subsp. uncialis TaxID=180999 RepID=A0A2K9YDU7_CLAUC|nr:hypothetical protein [Cladonia uncialis subsp. uncialis]